MNIGTVNIKYLLLTICWLSIGQLSVITSQVQAKPIDRIPNLRITSIPASIGIKAIVNSNSDRIDENGGLTLREAIDLVNGTLSISNLSPSKRSQVQELGQGRPSRIEFNLPSGQTKIALTKELPAIQASGVAIDGTTQAGFIPASTNNNRRVMPTPVVEITPADNIEIARGISILADDVSVKGLSIYGFCIDHKGPTQDVPAGDIFISHQLPPPSTVQSQPPAANFPYRDSQLPPRNILIEGNYLGIKPDRTVPAMPSDFGVYVFNSTGATIKNNAINSHTASGIITSVKADNLLVEENVIIGNGMSGMPDAIRLEGEIRNNAIKTNLICANDGSGVFIFKPAVGYAAIDNNTIQFNGRRLRRSAIHLMGNDNRVTNNYITNQTGAGVAVSAFNQPHVPTQDAASARNFVRQNRFAFLEGLSIDLNTHRNVGVEDFQDGDGINPERNTNNRRLDTGNMAINAPKFLSRDFLAIEDRVYVDGTADPGSEVELYLVNEDSTAHGPLSKSLGMFPVDNKGRFKATLMGLKPGDAISGVASFGKYGSSEPARNALIIGNAPTPQGQIEQPFTLVAKPECSPGGNFSVPLVANPSPTAPVAQLPTSPDAPMTPPPAPAPKTMRISIPANIHFALDRSYVSPTSGEVVQNIAAVMKEYPYLVVDLEGHTDPRANNEYNQRLGFRRAQATRDYLVRQGISPERITIRSFGETRLKTPRTDILNHARNRRVQFIYRDVRGVELEIIEQENDLQLEQRRGGNNVPGRG
jgi:outer membrane protein OmpA-like peptidoglycan-associated protein